MTWKVRVCKLVEDNVETVTFDVGKKENGWRTFQALKKNASQNKDKTICVELLDDADDIVDDFSTSSKHANEIVSNFSLRFAFLNKK